MMLRYMRAKIRCALALRRVLLMPLLLQLRHFDAVTRLLEAAAIDALRCCHDIIDYCRHTPLMPMLRRAKMPLRLMLLMLRC